MTYIEVKVKCPEDSKELLIFEFNQFEHVSFWEHEDGFSAYFLADEFNKQHINSSIKNLLKNYPQVSFTHAEQPKINWNKEWESNYSPIVLAKKYFIRAPFHEVKKDLVNFTIMPDMAFGTGHHATTELIFTLMEGSDLSNYKILDFGCGTGILSILADFKGASSIMAIDIEEEAIEITTKNAEINGCKHIKSLLLSIEDVPETNFDCILANINRNTLLNNVESISKKLKQNGLLFLSGFYTEDLKLIQVNYEKYNIFIEKKLEKNNWVGLACRKRK
ncbi:MAG: 50S ribosomal protein L11 methyltransferase [Bacteroidetes bacterium]|nr:50S ribosomal protein L11 methyltransferase [Bacteroidota bacterium]